LIDLIGDFTIPEKSAFSYRATASDPDGNAGDMRFSLGSSSPGFVINPITGDITWQTGENDGGRSVSVIVVATDAGTPPAVSNRGFKVHVTDVNDAPVIAPVGPQTLTFGTVLLVDMEASDPDFPLQSLTYSLVDAPEGAVIHPVSGLITWVPTNEQAGRNYLFKVAASDAGSPSLSGVTSFSATVTGQLDNSPVFTSVPFVLWTQGKSYSLTVTAADVDGDSISLAANLGGAPGATFADQGGGSGRLNWNLATTEKGVYQVPVAATANGRTTNATVRIRVEKNELYWSWVQEAFGDLPSGYDLSLLDPTADPDGDGRGNVHERAFLANPLAKDEVPITIRSEREDPFATVHLGFKRRKGSDSYVNFGVSRGATLVDAWQKVPGVDMRSTIDAAGDTDGRPETEDMNFSIFEYHEGGLPAGYFYRIQSTAKPVRP